jgi:hypothetical protein
MLSLGYYANQISVHFKLESIVTHAGLYHFKMVGQGVPIQAATIIQTAEFLLNMFRNEFIPIKKDIQVGEGVKYMIEKAEKNKMLK